MVKSNFSGQSNDFTRFSLDLKKNKHITMITKQYNPSQLEVEIAQAIMELAPQIEAKLNSCKISAIEDRIKEDNPMLKIKLVDSD
ncbi:hypothetical protein C9994_15035, partial [Marivirga lumbricoides]